MLLSEVRKNLGDLVVREEDTTFTREQVVVKTPAGVGVTAYNLFGAPCVIARVDDNHWRATLVAAANVNTANGILISDEAVTLAADGTTTKRYAAICRGATVINKNAIKATDPAGASYNKDTAAVALAAAGIVCRAEAPVATLGTT